METQALYLRDEDLGGKTSGHSWGRWAGKLPSSRKLPGFIAKKNSAYGDGAWRLAFYDPSEEGAVRTVDWMYDHLFVPTYMKIIRENEGLRNRLLQASYTIDIQDHGQEASRIPVINTNGPTELHAAAINTAVDRLGFVYGGSEPIQVRSNNIALPELSPRNVVQVIFSPEVLDDLRPNMASYIIGANTIEGAFQRLKRIVVIEGQ